MQVFSIKTVHDFRHYLLLGVFHTEMYLREKDDAHLLPGCEFAGMARALHNQDVHGELVDNLPDFAAACVYAAAYYSQN
jgi:hypothetical protein